MQLNGRPTIPSHEVIILMKNRSRPIDETLDSGTRQVVLRVAERLMQASIDEIVSYADLNEVAECDIRTTDPGWLAGDQADQQDSWCGVRQRAQSRLSPTVLGSRRQIRW